MVLIFGLGGLLVLVPIGFTDCWAPLILVGDPLWGPKRGHFVGLGWGCGLVRGLDLGLVKGLVFGSRLPEGWGAGGLLALANACEVSLGNFVAGDNEVSHHLI